MHIWKATHFNEGVATNKLQSYNSENIRIITWNSAVVISHVLHYSKAVFLPFAECIAKLRNGLTVRKQPDRVFLNCAARYFPKITNKWNGGNRSWALV